MKQSLCFVLSLLLLAAPAFGAEKSALLIGVADYRNSGNNLEDLKGPINDVLLIQEQILPVLGYRFDKIITLTGRDATRSNIQKAIATFVKHGGVDERFFFFAGHGSQVPDTDGDETDDVDEVILPYDAKYDGQGNLIPGSVISDDDLKEWFAPLKGKKLFAVLDSCHSGTGFRAMDLSFNAVQTRFADNPAARSARGMRGGIGAFASAGGGGAIESGDEIPDNHIYLYAALSDRPAKEKSFDGKWQGCFTKAFAESVTSIAVTSTGDNSYMALFRKIDQVMKEKINLDQPIDIQPKYRGSNSANYRNTESERLLEPFFDKNDVAAGHAATLETRLPDIGAYRTRVLIRREGDAPIIDQGDLADARPFADIDFGTQGGGHNLYVAIDGNARKVSLTNENGYHLNDFVYMDKPGLVKELLTRIRHQYLKDLLIQIESKNGFPLSLETIYKGRPYERNDFFCRQQITYRFQSNVDVYLYVLSVDSGGEFNIYMPFELQPDNHIQAGGQLLLPDQAICGNDVFLEMTCVPGEEILKLIASPSPLQIKKAKIQDMGDEEWLTRVNFQEALDAIKSLVDQLKKRKGWYSSAKRFMNYSQMEYQRLYSSMD